MRLKLESDKPRVSSTGERSERDGYFEGLGVENFGGLSDLTCVYSFWSRPYRNSSRGYGGFETEADYVASWALSVALARMRFSRVILCTDVWGLKYLGKFNLLDLFDDVSTMLDSLIPRDTPASLWAIGKLHVYAEMTKPFIHMDNDVFLWSGLPRRITEASIFAQNLESKPWAQSYYQAGVDILREFGVAELNWHPCGYNMGIFGGRDVQSINSYAMRSLDVIEGAPERIRSVHPQLMTSVLVLLEQGGLYDFVTKRGLDCELLIEESRIFESKEARESETSAYGYTHLCGQMAKRSERTLAEMRRALRRLSPSFHDGLFASTRFLMENDK